MPPKIPLEPDTFYHIFNRGNNRENIFFEPENYSYFLRLYSKYICPIAQTFAYALLPNHYHFLIQIKKADELPDAFQKKQRSLGIAFGHWQNAYAKAINKKYGRVSSLFEDRYERVRVNTETRFLHLVHYIHYNPEKHGYAPDFTVNPYTSYRSFFSPEIMPIALEREMILDYLGGEEGFVRSHLMFRDRWRNQGNEPDDLGFTDD